jgi:hypothetical protein
MLRDPDPPKSSPPLHHAELKLLPAGRRMRMMDAGGYRVAIASPE